MLDLFEDTSLLVGGALQWRNSLLGAARRGDGSVAGALSELVHLALRGGRIAQAIPPWITSTWPQTRQRRKVTPRFKPRSSVAE